MTSKTKLGAIILAFQLLREAGISVPRLVSCAAASFGLSRKTGYQSAREIRERLVSHEAEEKKSEGGADEGELARLRIKVQIVTFERDHPGLRFSERHLHLSDEARSLAVRLLRDFSSTLSASQIARTIGVPLSSLERWDGEADADCRFPPKPDRRGEHRRASDADVERVLAAWRDLSAPMTLEEFAAHLSALHPDRPLDRKTITRILAAHQEHRIEPRPGKEKTASYHPRFEVYYPGAQIAVDATETAVVFSSSPDNPVKLQTEVAVDIASGAIVGDAVGKEETAEGVERVIVKARSECQKVLAALSDNGSANHSERIARRSDQELEVGQIFSFPRHPQTNGLIEGLFGQFKRLVARIEIDDTSRETITFSVVALLWRIFIHFHNYAPRKRLGGLSPLEHLRSYSATDGQVEAARAGLEARRKRSESLRRPHARLSDPRFRQLVEQALARAALAIDIDEASKALLPFDESVIRNAATAFFVASARDGFDERKRSFAYFMGIVKKKQQAIDADRVRSQLGREDMERCRAEALERERERELKEKEEREDLERQPERVVLNYARMLLSSRLRYMPRTFGTGLRRGLEALVRLGRGTRARVDELAGTIRSWGDFNEELKEKMVEMLIREHSLIADSS